ncbi:AI-2E family transporter [Myxosarcina sp. GI1]|uniref:AI-2E family transporter n=1 Tax=Myxosarcina sp. GI1 TaxID=1541065 RepID=UPI00055D6A6B|nr:AI-2E family transporter [Myxosarcina sp. GI1]
MNKPKTSSNKFWQHLNNSQLVRYLLLFGLAWAIAELIAYFETVLIIFIFATIVAFLLDYPVSRVSRFMPRWLAVILVFLLALVILGTLMATLGLTMVSQIRQLLEQAPELSSNALEFLNNLPFLQNNEIDLNAFEAQLREKALGLIGKGLAGIQNVLVSLLDLVLIAVVAFFMLLDGKPLWNFALSLFPAHLREDLTVAISKNFLGFFWGRLLLSIFFALSAFLVFVLLGIPYAVALAAIAGVFDLIPGIGATLGIGLICLIILPQGILLGFKVLISCILLQQVEENLLMPRIMQGCIQMNPVVMFLALLVGARVAGLIGVFLSIPLAGILISLFNVDEIRGKT